MFIRAPSRIVFDDTYATPWQSLIFPNFKDCIKTEALRSWHLAKERKNTPELTQGKMKPKVADTIWVFSPSPHTHPGWTDPVMEPCKQYNQETAFPVYKGCPDKPIVPSKFPVSWLPWPSPQPRAILLSSSFPHRKPFNQNWLPQSFLPALRQLYKLSWTLSIQHFPSRHRVAYISSPKLNRLQDAGALIGEVV